MKEQVYLDLRSGSLMDEPEGSGLSAVLAKIFDWLHTRLCEIQLQVTMVKDPR